jgi:hypothetical protein
MSKALVLYQLYGALFDVRGGAERRPCGRPRLRPAAFPGWLHQQTQLDITSFKNLLAPTLPDNIKKTQRARAHTGKSFFNSTQSAADPASPKAGRERQPLIGEPPMHNVARRRRPLRTVSTRPQRLQRPQPTKTRTPLPMNTSARRAISMSTAIPTSVCSASSARSGVPRTIPQPSRRIVAAKSRTHAVSRLVSTYSTSR